MPTFTPPVRDMAFVINEIGALDRISALPGYEEATPDLVGAVLEEAGRFGAGVLAPLNPVGDREGCELEGEKVKLPTGFVDAYRRFVESGWNAVPFEPEFGGQGLPWLVATAVQEIWHAANMSFGLIPMLTQGAVELLSVHGTADQKALLLPQLVSGAWTGTMNLTEPGAGSDVGALRTRAVRDGDRYRITGQKIFITAGEHDAAENIIHLVLARLPDAPPGAKGISLFVVPKFLVNPDGSLGKRNDVSCIKLEHKMGINGSPTCVMAFGEDEGAIGTLVGRENQGLALMFTMMNNARLAVGLQGVAIAERATQKAVAYARERIQGIAPGRDAPGPIIHHPDVRRMLMTQRALVEAGRALTYFTAAQIDLSRRSPDKAERAAAHALVDLLIPVVKSWGTANGVQIADMAVQVFGGMGFVEETGVAQHLRDARIAPIYEGTNGIQALDLIGRKLIRDRGEAMQALLTQIRQTEAELAEVGGEALARLRSELAAATTRCAETVAWILAHQSEDPNLAGAVASPFLNLVAFTAGGWMTARMALAAQRQLASASDDPFLMAKITTARFYADQILPQTAGLSVMVTAGADSVMALAVDGF
ncbi:acyl-CoA dehydrogenase [Magnetospirillum molischianum]|uniref:3-methylmercaptopropionyl-CoA dehydrogenase n=1 Tax=Magnetospirillum molischianum DSM 120 TaxID=1150626 RepID=H8FPI2_MAGML|nr:acyl-CoA dehydrogenase [Magnetospirillum molischianum]CCG40270.1 putative Acyl-CoA dehydrogenase [Magnetospirillum molischianum DSM 120]